jgi:AraC family transcriptional regulator, arabinose operon regulatory protein
VNLRVGVRERGATGLRVVRPHGSGDWVLVHALEPLALEPSHHRRLEPGECIWYAPDTPTYLEGLNGTILNDYVHLNENPWLEFGFVPNVPVRAADPTNLTRHLERLASEWLARDAHWETAIRASLLEIGLNLARGALETAPRSAHEAGLLETRALLTRDLEHPWTVGELAQRLSLSQSRFYALYRARFGRSPMQDLILARLERAKAHLKNTTLSVAEVAELSGFFDVYYFSRCFKKHVGCSPRAFRGSRP